VTDVSDIAVAAPIVTGTPPDNQGTATISAGLVSDHNDLVKDRQYEIVFDVSGGTSTYQVLDVTDQANPSLVADGPYVAGAAISFEGVQVTISGQPANGDKFTVGPNVNHEGDSRNAILLGDLQGLAIFDGGAATYQGAYAQMVTAIGNQTREAEVTSAAAGK